MKISRHKLCLKQSAPWCPKPFFFFQNYYLTAEGLSISEHPWIIPWQKHLGRNSCVSFTDPKNAHFTLFRNRNPFFTIKKENHHSKWITPLEGYDQDNFKLGFGVSTYFYTHARLFLTQWPPYYANIMQGLLRSCEHWPADPLTPRPLPTPPLQYVRAHRFNICYGFPYHCTWIEVNKKSV